MGSTDGCTTSSSPPRPPDPRKGEEGTLDSTIDHPTVAETLNTFRVSKDPSPPGPPDPALLRILAAARERFFAIGFQGTTMDDLAVRLGMSKKTLYLHFATKEALLDAVLDALAVEIGELLQAHLSAPGPVRARVTRFTSALVTRMHELQPVFLHSLERYAPRQFQRLEELRRRNLERHLVPVLREGQRTGEVRRSLDPALAVELLLNSLHGLLNAGTLGRLSRTPAQVVAQTLDLFFHGVLQP